MNNKTIAIALFLLTTVFMSVVLAQRPPRRPTPQKNEEIDVPVLCATLRHRVAEILTDKTITAAKDLGYSTIALAGGVSANSELRKLLSAACEENGITLYKPELKYCGDNAAMVGVGGYYEYLSGNIGTLDLNAAATMPINYR